MSIRAAFSKAHARILDDARKSTVLLRQRRNASGEGPKRVRLRASAEVDLLDPSQLYTAGESFLPAGVKEESSKVAAGLATLELGHKNPFGYCVPVIANAAVLASASGSPLVFSARFTHTAIR